MKKCMRRRPAGRLLSLSLCSGLLVAGQPAAWAGSLEGLGDVQALTPAAAEADQAKGLITAFVKLSGEPAALTFARSMEAAGTGDAARAQAGGASKAQVARIEAEQAAAAPAIAAAGARVLYRTTKALNGFAVQVAADKLDALRAIPGVVSVHPMVPQEIENSTSLPFLGVPAHLWDAADAGVTGAGVRIGIIDTGIDYQHAMFGGTGLQADYLANNRTVAEGSGPAVFPTAKVIGGWDFAGDGYTGSNAAVPDPDPMDCNGHGSHVAGTAAGLGVTGAGTTYTGPYDASANLGALRIGPGAAPGALLYALRVFGCTGSTNLTPQAIDWAMDPNGDNNLADHLDVINMSLGSSFGSMLDASTEASNNAAAAGVVVVTSAGNSGDVYFITGSPGSASGATAVAATADLLPVVHVVSGPLSGQNYGAQGAQFGANGGTFSGNVVLALDPADGAGPLTTDGCSALTNAAAVNGNIAIIDRGTCGFIVKVKNAQNAGATGVIIANSAAGAFGPMGGSDPTITVTAVMVTFADGNTIKANLGSGVGVNMTQDNVGDTLASFSSRGPRRAWGFKPDVAAPGSNITSSQTGIVCKTGTLNCTAPTATAIDAFAGVLAGSQALTISGTSMAAPHVAGIMATLKELHPTWKPGELRSLLRATSTRDIFSNINSTPPAYGPGRVGAGRVEMDAVGDSQVIVGDDGDLAGGMAWERVGKSFGTVISGPYSKTQSITLRNKGTSPASFNVSYLPVVDNPGVAVSFPGGGTVTVPAKGNAILQVQVTSPGASSVVKTRDLTVAPTQTSAVVALTLPREWLPEESGQIVLTSTTLGQPSLRVPFHMSPRPGATLKATQFSSPLVLTGTGFSSVNPALGLGVEVPLASWFEWAATSPNEPQPGLTGGDALAERLLDSADLHYVGVASDYGTAAPGSERVFFGISTWENWSTPNEVEFRVWIDADRNGTFDFRLFNANSTRSLSTTFSGQTGFNDALVTDACTAGGSCLIGLDFLNLVGPNYASTQLFNTNVMVLSAPIASLNTLTGAPDITGRFNYWIEARNREGGVLDTVGSAASPLTYDPFAPGLSFATGTVVFVATAGTPLANTLNSASFAANASQGALLLHHHGVNVRGRESALPIGYWVTVGDASVTEGNTGTRTLNFTVSLSAPATGRVEVKLATSDGSATAGSDYTAKTGSVIFGAGQTSKTFSVVVKGDVTDCTDETINLNVTSVAGAPVGDGSAVGTILNDDVCP